MTCGRAGELTAALESRLVATVGADLPVDRRTVLGGLGLAGSAAIAGVASADDGGGAGDDDHDERGEHGDFGAVGEYDDANFDPHEFLREFNTGRGEAEHVPQRTYEEDGRTVREFEFTAVDTTITIAPGVEFPAWAYNGQVPGPTIRAVEGDLVNSFHTHSQFFDYYDHGTTLFPTSPTVDTVMQCQAQRGIIEIDYASHDPGLYMFHAHQSEFAELGWMSFFEVV
jgi:FtsP/CotA-like multicopper oxidase with cupredoxin domain